MEEMVEGEPPTVEEPVADAEVPPDAPADPEPTGDAFQAEKPRMWSETPVRRRPQQGASFDLHPDGERVAMAPATQATAGPTHVTLVFNFFDELRRLAPVGK